MSYLLKMVPSSQEDFGKPPSLPSYRTSPSKHGRRSSGERSRNSRSSRKTGISEMLKQMETGVKTPSVKSMSLKSPSVVSGAKRGSNAELKAVGGLRTPKYSSIPEANDNMRTSMALSHRQTAYFEKKESAHDHYMRHFAQAPPVKQVRQPLSPADDGDVSIAHGKPETPLLREGQILRTDGKDAGKGFKIDMEESFYAKYGHAADGSAMASQKQADEVKMAPPKPDGSEKEEKELQVVTATPAQVTSEVTALQKEEGVEATENAIEAVDGLIIEYRVPVDALGDVEQISSKVEDEVVSDEGKQTCDDETQDGKEEPATEAIVTAKDPISETEEEEEEKILTEAKTEEEDVAEAVAKELESDAVDIDYKAELVSDISEACAVERVSSESDQSSEEEVRLEEVHMIKIVGDESEASDGVEFTPAPVLKDIPRYEQAVIERPESLSTWGFSADKDILALGGEMGSLKVFILDPHIRGQPYKNVPVNEIKRQIKPDYMLWGIITKTPTASMHAHMGCITSIHIQERESPAEVAKILTTGRDSCLKLWAIHSDRTRVWIKLVTTVQLLDSPVSALPIRNTRQIMVSFREGDIAMYRIDEKLLSGDPNSQVACISSTDTAMDEECDILAVEVSISGKFIAVCSDRGLIILHDSYNMNIVGWAECKNSKGLQSRGADVVGVNWNRRENLMLVTTKDSRIRMLSTIKGSEDELVRLEKFKGHRNRKLPFKAQFAGPNDEYVISLCEMSFIYVWKHHIHHNYIFQGTPPIIPTNTNALRLKFDAPMLSPQLAIFNPGEWDHIKMLISKQKTGNAMVTRIPRSRFQCLPWAKRYACAQNINVQESDVKNHILLMAAENDSVLWYSLISLQLLVDYFT